MDNMKSVYRAYRTYSRLGVLIKRMQSLGMFTLCLFVEWTIQILFIVKGIWEDYLNRQGVRHGCIPKTITSS